MGSHFSRPHPLCQHGDDLLLSRREIRHSGTGAAISSHAVTSLRSPRVSNYANDFRHCDVPKNQGLGYKGLSQQLPSLELGLHSRNRSSPGARCRDVEQGADDALVCGTEVAEENRRSTAPQGAGEFIRLLCLADDLEIRFPFQQSSHRITKGKNIAGQYNGAPIRCFAADRLHYRAFSLKTITSRKDSITVMGVCTTIAVDIYDIRMTGVDYRRE